MKLQRIDRREITFRALNRTDEDEGADPEEGTGLGRPDMVASAGGGREAVTDPTLYASISLLHSVYSVTV